MGLTTQLTDADRCSAAEAPRDRWDALTASGLENRKRFGNVPRRRSGRTAPDLPYKRAVHNDCEQWPLYRARVGARRVSASDQTRGSGRAERSLPGLDISGRVFGAVPRKPPSGRGRPTPSLWVTKPSVPPSGRYKRGPGILNHCEYREPRQPLRTAARSSDHQHRRAGS